MKSWQEEEVQTLLSSNSTSELFQQLSKIAHGLGFDYCAYGIRMPLPISAPKVEMFNNYPISWQKQYQAQNYLATDPTVTLGIKSTMPFLWTDGLFASARELWEDARAHGLEYGWAQSCHDAHGIVGMLTLSRSDEQIPENEVRSKMAELSWLVQIAHLGMSRHLTPSMMPEANVTLSQREVAVLRWTAEGKTTSEVAEILKISDRTVNFHLNNAVSKLNAPNKTAAAVRAAVLGLLY